jgi:hypothetical protein
LPVHGACRLRTLEPLRERLDRAKISSAAADEIFDLLGLFYCELNPLHKLGQLISELELKI